MNYYIDDNMSNLEVKKLRDGQEGTPPRERVYSENKFYLYKVKNKNIYDFNLMTNKENEDE
jgi:D-alanine-D-alanine ligase-like ATP-grasp enzyme